MHGNLHGAGSSPQMCLLPLKQMQATSPGCYISTLSAEENSMNDGTSWAHRDDDFCLLTRGCPCQSRALAGPLTHNRTSNDHIFGSHIMAMNTKTYGSNSLKYFQQVSLVVKWDFTTSWEPILPHRNCHFFCFVLNLYWHINLLRNPLYSSL